MKEYCRYCINLNCTYEADNLHFFCNEKEKYVNIYSRCNKYLYCGLNEHMEVHKPRKVKEKQNDGEQLEIGVKNK